MVPDICPFSGFLSAFLSYSVFLKLQHKCKRLRRDLKDLVTNLPGDLREIPSHPWVLGSSPVSDLAQLIIFNSLLAQ